MLNSWLTQSVKSFAQTCGFQISRFNPAACHFTMLAKALRVRNIDIVLDIGANVGQFACGLRRAGFTGRIISFEPLSSAHAQLRRAAKGDKNWLVHDRGAISDHRGVVELNISSNSVSSSTLKLLETHIAAAPESVVTDVEKCECWSLDETVARYLDEGDKPFIKIDTQGAEWEVLDGAQRTLSRSSGLLVELSFVPLYEGQRLWRDLIDRLAATGFHPWRFDPAFTNAQTGRTLQADCTFFRE